MYWLKSRSRFGRVKPMKWWRRPRRRANTSWSATFCHSSLSLPSRWRPLSPAVTVGYARRDLMRVISKPDWSNEIADPQRSGGPAIDLHIHDTHFIGLICGVPRAVHSRGVVENGAVVHLATQYLYDVPDLTVSCVSGALSQAGRPFAHGFELYFERGTLAFEFANLGGHGHAATPLTIILPDGTVTQPNLGSGDPVDTFTEELSVAAKAIASGHEAERLSGNLARQALRVCLAEIESVKTQTTVELASF